MENKGKSPQEKKTMKKEENVCFQIEMRTLDVMNQLFHICLVFPSQKILPKRER